MARALLARPDLGPEGVWPRAAAILARQTLELTLTRVWSESGSPQMQLTSFRCQLLCLPVVLEDTELISEVRAAWFFLTRACHHHQYELAPVAAELEDWISKVEALLEAIGEGLGHR